MFTGDERWSSLEIPEGDRYAWTDSTYVRKPPFFEGMDPEPQPPEPIAGRSGAGRARRQRHHRPHLAGGRDQEGQPGRPWLIDHGVEVRDFNSYGSRRGNHEVMIRGTFANVRLRNRLVEREGGFTRHFPDGEETTIYEAAMRYADEGVPLVVLAGKEYGSGSSRDWAAKGTALLGVRAVIAESFERIHRSNLIGMGVLPLQFPAGESVDSLGPHRARRCSTSRASRRRSPPERRGAQGARHGRAGRRRPRRVRRPCPARHAERGRLLPQRRHPATRSARPSLTYDDIANPGSVRRRISFLLTLPALMHQNALTTNEGDFKARPRPVPPPGAIASASLPGYRRAGVGAGCVDPLPPTAPPRHALGPCKPSHRGVLGERLAHAHFECTRFAARPASCQARFSDPSRALRRRVGHRL